MELVAQGLCVERGERRVIGGLGLRVGAGEVLIVTGVNGAGKSTLLRALAGLLVPAAGTILLGAHRRDGDAHAYTGQLHYLGHRDAVKGALTVAQNLAYWQEVLAPAETRAPAAEALAAFGLEGLASMPAAYLSAGLRRRLALTRLLAVPRPLWLLDEPAAGLDAPSRAALGDAIGRHCAGGGLAVVASHGELSLPAAQTLALERA